MRQAPVIVIGLSALGAVALVFAVSFLASAPRDSGNTHPPRTARVLVDDAAALMTPEQRDRVSEFHNAILGAYDIDYRVATANGEPDVNVLAATRFEDLEIGSMSSAGRGLLLLIVPDTQQVRIEVGRGLEPVYTDVFIAYVEARQMVPFFQANRVADGILATTELIAARAAEAMANEAFDDPADGAVEPSTGAGARVDADIGAGYTRPSGGRTGPSAQGLGPEEVVDAYLDAMAAGNANPELEIFTPGTRDMMRGWVVTRAQMAQMSRTYAQCGAIRVLQASRVAAVRYEVTARACAPFFLRLTESGWQLDLTVMSQAIRFNHRNDWRFPDGPPAEFAFAFEDWTFDRHGFPHGK